VTRWDAAYAAKPVLVIGGLGFIGVNLSRRLLSNGARVTILTPSRTAHEEDARELELGGASIFEGDLRDAARTSEAVAGQALIFNVSGRSGAVQSMDDPLGDLDVNCRGNLVLLDAVRRLRPDAKLVFPGSRLEYGRPASNPVDEDAPLDPLCVHAVHKIAVEQYLRIYGRLYELRFTVLRVTNPYGPGQAPGRTAYGIVNRMIQLAVDNEDLPVYGDGRQTRDYLYIEDLVDAFLGAGADTRTDGRTYNVGSGVATSFAEMARTVIALTGSGRLVFRPWPRVAEQIETGDFTANISRLQSDVGWAPSTRLDEGLARTIAAYRARVRV
jgi:UDP-glucose 4-epimerase